MPKVKHKRGSGGKAKAAGPAIKAWSFSRWSDYEKCPAFAKYRHIDRLPEPEAPPLLRGQAVHNAGEDYLNKGGRVPAAYKFHRSDLKDLRAKRAIAEGMWAFDVNWLSTDWFSPSAWCRIKTDAHYLNASGTHCTVIDFKTGKRYPTHEKQMELYALGAFALYPDVEKVDADLWYLDIGDGPDSGDIDGIEVKRKEYPSLVQTWEKRTTKMLEDRTFKPRPSGACRWCNFSVKKGGPCEAGA